jgi:hypothetical protein
MPLSVTMSCVAVLLIATCFAIAISRMLAASSLVYGLPLLIYSDPRLVVEYSRARVWWHYSNDRGYATGGFHQRSAR